MTRLNYNQLYYFFVVATEGSVKAASQKLHLTQPTISGQLKTLEQDLGYPLFDRLYRKLELNEHGERILKKAEKIFMLGDELIATLTNKNGSGSKYKNEINIGVVPALPHMLTHEFTWNLWRDNSEVAHLHRAPLPELLKALDEDRVDLILSDTLCESADKYNTYNLGQQKFVAVASEKFKDAMVNFPTSLNGLPYLALNMNNRLQDQIDYFFTLRNVRPHTIGTADDANFIMTIALQGICFSILPEKNVSGLIAEGHLVLLGEINDIASNFWILTTALGSKRIAVRKLINDYIVKDRSELHLFH